MKYLFMTFLLLFTNCSNQNKYDDTEAEEIEIGYITEYRNGYYGRNGIIYKYDLTNLDDDFKYGFDVQAQINDNMIKTKNPAHDFFAMGGILGYISEERDLSSIVPFF